MATRTKQKTMLRHATADNRPTATAKFQRISPFKVRIVLKLIRGKSVNEALAIWKIPPRRQAKS